MASRKQWWDEKRFLVTVINSLNVCLPLYVAKGIYCMHCLPIGHNLCPVHRTD